MRQHRSLFCLHLWTYFGPLLNASGVMMKRLPVRFFETEAGAMPVREWLLSLSPEDRAIIGQDIMTLEIGWPIGMPLCRALKGHKGLWEVRCQLPRGRIARVLFCVHQGNMALLH